METRSSYETRLNFYQNARCHIQDTLSFNSVVAFNSIIVFMSHVVISILEIQMLDSILKTLVSSWANLLYKKSPNFCPRSLFTCSPHSQIK